MRATFQMETGDGRLHTRNDAGPMRIRRKYSQVANTVAITIDVDRNQLARFDRFYNEEIGSGTLPFLMTDPMTAALPLLDADTIQLTTHDGKPLVCAATWVCLMGEQPPVRTPIGVRWRVSFQVMVMP